MGLCRPCTLLEPPPKKTTEVSTYTVPGRAGAILGDVSELRFSCGMFSVISAAGLSESEFPAVESEVRRGIATT